MNNLEVTNLIHTLATHPNEYTIQPEGKKAIRIVPSKNSFGQNTFDEKKFSQALTKLLGIVHSRPELLSDQTVRSDLCHLSEGLLDNVNQISNPVKGEKVYQEIMQLMTEVIFNQWGSNPSSNVGEVIDSLPISAGQRNVLRHDFIEKTGDIFFQGHTLGISTKFFADNSDDAVRQKITAVLNRYPFISSVQIQGHDPIPRDHIQQRLKDKVPLKDLANPPIRARFQDSDEEKEVVIHTNLLSESAFFQSRESFVTQAGTPDNLKNFVTLPIDPKVFALINQDFDSIELDRSNIADVIGAAHFLQSPALLKKCDEALCKFWDEDLAIQGNDDFGRAIVTKYQEIDDLEFPQTRMLLEKKINQWITFGQDADRTVHCLEVVQQLKHPLKSLDLSGFFNNPPINVFGILSKITLSDVMRQRPPPPSSPENNLIKILNACPTTLTSLNLANIQGPLHDPFSGRKVQKALDRLSNLQELNLSGVRYRGKLHIPEKDLEGPSTPKRRRLY